MKILYQSLKNGEYVRVIEGVSMVTWASNGDPRVHKRDGSSYNLELDQYKILSIS